MKDNEFILWFSELGKEDVSRVGGKCANLGELYRRIGVPVPEGFAISAYAYSQFLEKNRAVEKVESLLTGIDTSRLESVQKVSRKIRRFIEGLPVPKDIEKAIIHAYRELCRRTGKKKAPVSVRSSATAEDLPGASFAGQQDTFLNVRSEEELVRKVRKCWSSLFTPRAIVYRKEKGFRDRDVLISVAVQQMVEALASGVMFTLEPVSGERDRIVINSSWGLGEAVVSGQITPDEFVVDKKTLQIIDRKIFKKTRQVVYDKKGGTKWASVPVKLQEQQSLTDEQIVRLAEYGLKIEKHYGCPQDIEWAVDSDGNIFILQARPETVYGMKIPGEKPKEGGAIMEEEVIVKGLGVSPGKGSGRARIILDVEGIKDFQEGEVLVTEMTTPDWVTAMKKASAIVTDLGGKTCHAAIVSRELGIPCVVGTEVATKTIKEGSIITVDGQRGLVLKGAAAPEEAGEEVAPAVAPDIITATRVYVNLSVPEIAEKVARQTNADGVGLLRAEHMMLSIGKHPRALIEEGGDQLMIDNFAAGISQVAEAFYPRPVVYRFLDFKPDEFLALPGGEKYERDHVGPNPMIGFRGQFRYVKEDDLFRLELRAVRKARDEKGFKNVWVMIPFVRTLEVFRRTVEIMREEGLDNRTDRDFQLWIMVEVPSACFMIEEFCKEGIDGVSFGTNDLTMLILGLDRNDASVQEIYDERNLAVLRAIAYTINVCRKYGVTTSICGQAPSVYPDYLEFMIRCGCTSISVNPDVVVSSKKMVAKIEQKIQLEKALGVVPKPVIGKIPMEEVFFWRKMD